LLGTVDAASAHSQVHDGAVYLHQGTNYVVDHLDVDQAAAFVHREDPLHTTHPQSTSTLRVRQTDREVAWSGGVRLCFEIGRASCRGRVDDAAVLREV